MIDVNAMFYEPMLAVVKAGIWLLIGSMGLVFSFKVLRSTLVGGGAITILSLLFIAIGTYQALHGPYGHLGWYAPMLCLAIVLPRSFKQRKPYRY